MNKTYYPINGRILLYSYDDHLRPLRLTATALTDLATEEVRIADWKINDARTEVTLTIVDGYGVNTRVFPCEVKETPLPKPGRNFRWSVFGGYWVNKSTGVRVVNV